MSLKTELEDCIKLDTIKCASIKYFSKNVHLYLKSNFTKEEFFNFIDSLDNLESEGRYTVSSNKDIHLIGTIWCKDSSWVTIEFNMGEDGWLEYYYFQHHAIPKIPKKLL